MFKKILAYLIIIGMLVLSGCQGAVKDEIKPTPESGEKKEAVDAGFRLVEGDGTEFVLEKAPERIVVNSLGTALIMDALGIPIAGMTTTSRQLPESLKGVPDVGTPPKPNIEKIVSLNPELTIVSSEFKDAQKDMFSQNGIKTYFIDNQMYADTYKSVEILGKAFGKEEKAEELLKDIKQREEKALARAENKTPPKVLVIFGTSQSFQIATDRSYVGNMVKMLKSTNIADKAAAGDNGGVYIPFSAENIVEENPDIILRIAHGNAEEVRKLYEKEFENNSIWKSVAAVKNNRVYDLEEELFRSNPGLKTIDALEALAKMLYP